MNTTNPTSSSESKNTTGKYLPKKRKQSGNRNNNTNRRRGPNNNSGGNNYKRNKDDVMNTTDTEKKNSNSNNPIDGALTAKRTNSSQGRSRNNNNNRGRNRNKNGKRKEAPTNIENAPVAKAPAGEKQGDSKNSNNDTTKKVHMTDKRFSDLTQVCDASRRALAEIFKYEYMTEVQEQTLPVILDSQRKIDVLAKAKTGTGKTLGFLIPTVENLLLSASKSNMKQNDMIGSLIISPTRELAYQISKEADKLLTFQRHPKMSVVTCVGGTPVQRDRNALKRGNNVQIVVATPGRLIDHLQNSDLQLANRMSQLEVLVLDEADQLLDMGFRPDIERILNLLKPSQGTRQTLLFSATVPKSVNDIASIALKPKYEYIDTVGEDAEQTHAHVRQEVMVAPSSNNNNNKSGGSGSNSVGDYQIRAIASLLDREIKAANQTNKPCKIIVFFTTARLTGFMAELFNSASNLTKFPTILEIHSRKSQAFRQKASEKFRSSKDNTILFSSDVSARGMDYPGITFVLQVGLTERAQYIHRLGRTARAGNEGLGTLLLAPYEHRFMTQKVLNDMPLQSEPVPSLPSNLGQAMDRAVQNVTSNKSLGESGEQAYRAWLGYYNGHLKKVGWDKKRLVQEANQWAKDVGLKQQPSLQKKTIGKMGLKGVPGLRIE